MMRRDRPSPHPVLFAVALAGWAVVACARHQDRTVAASDSTTSTAAGTVAAKPEPAPAATPPAPEEPEVTPATLTAKDLDIYHDALTARINAVKQARANEAKATSAVDSLRALNAISAESTDSTVARAAGVTPRHVSDVVTTVGDMLTNLQGQAMAANGIAQMDTTSMDADGRATARKVIAQLRQHSDSEASATTAGMSPEVAAAFAKRRPALDSLRTQALKLAFGGQ